MGLEKHGKVSGSKPRVSVAKSWVVTVNHGVIMGLGSASILTSFFLVKNDKKTRKCVTNPGNSSEVGILAAWAASPAGLTWFCRKTPVLNGTHGSDHQSR